MPAPPDPLPFTRIWGQLRVLDEIGRGAFSTVYRALDRVDREVALKLLSLGPEADVADRRRILREGRLLGRLSHPNVVAVLGADDVDGQVGLWMPLVRGTTLEDELTAHGPRGAREATLIGLDLCRALAAVHGAGLLHRDVKAQNVMREKGGRIVLMDLGAGLDVSRESAAHLSRALAGTPLYVAPELFQHQPPTVASDIYSVGVLLYHIVTGEFPVDGLTLDDLERAHARGERMRLRDARADLPDDFIRVVERAIAPRPDERYRSAGELEGALSQLLPQAAQPATPRASTRWWPIAAAVVLPVALVSAWLVARAMWPTSPPPVQMAALAPPPPAAPAVPQAYTVEAAFYKRRGPRETRLANLERVAPGDRLLLTLKASTAVHAYVYNEDAAGKRFALYPLDDSGFSTPLAAGRTHRLPVLPTGETKFWTVTSPGKREQFVVSVSPERDPMLEAWLKTLPRAIEGAPVGDEPEAPPTIGRLRGVGGLASRPARPDDVAPSPYPDPPELTAQAETVTGQWVRRLTLSNP